MKSVSSFRSIDFLRKKHSRRRCVILVNKKISNNIVFVIKQFYSMIPNVLYTQDDFIFLGRVYMPPCNSSIYNQCECDIYTLMTFKNLLSTAIGQFEPYILNISCKIYTNEEPRHFPRDNIIKIANV